MTTTVIDESSPLIVVTRTIVVTPEPPDPVTTPVYLSGTVSLEVTADATLHVASSAYTASLTTVPLDDSASMGVPAAQSFTPTSTITVTGAAVHAVTAMGATPGSAFTLRIFSGSISSPTTIATATNTAQVSGDTYGATFASPVTLTAGTQYYLATSGSLAPYLKVSAFPMVDTGITHDTLWYHSTYNTESSGFCMPFTLAATLAASTTPVSASTATSWNTLSIVSTSIATSWSVAVALTSVSASTAISWNTLSASVGSNTFANAPAIIIPTDYATFASGSFSNASYTVETSEPGTGVMTAWWIYKPTTTGYANFDLRDGVGNSVLYVYSATGTEPHTFADLTQIGYNDNYGVGVTSRISAGLDIGILTAGVTYYIQAASHDTSTGAITLALKVTGPRTTPAVIHLSGTSSMLVTTTDVAEIGVLETIALSATTVMELNVEDVAAHLDSIYKHLSATAVVDITTTAAIHMASVSHISGRASVLLGGHATTLHVVGAVVSVPKHLSGTASMDLRSHGSYAALLIHLSGTASANLLANNRGGLHYFSTSIPLWTVETRLYEADGLTFVTVLPLARKVQFQITNSQPGTATFELPLSDSRTALVTDDMIVKFSWAGRERFGCVVKTANCVLTSEDGVWINYSNQAGLLSLFSRAPVMPEYTTLPTDSWIPEMPKPGTMPKNAGSERLFGYMSKWGPWAISSDWVFPLGQKWNTPGSAKGANPSLFGTLDKNAYWIAPPPGPTANVPSGSTNYFRTYFWVDGTTAKTMQIIFAGDNFCTVYVDGELAIEPDMTKPLSWQTAQKKELQLQPGGHLLAAHVLNGGVAVSPPLVIAKSNVALTNTPNPLLGVTLAEGDYVLLTNQNTDSQNGTYIFYPATGTGTSARTNRLKKTSSNNPIALIGDIVYMSPTTGQPGSTVLKEELSGDLLFGNDRYSLTSQAETAITAIVNQITTKAPVINVEGHASSPGSEEDNMTLSFNRATSVKNFMVSELRKKSWWVDGTGPTGDERNIDLNWYGEDRPKKGVPWDSPVNRRVVIEYPISEPGVTSGTVLVPLIKRRTDMTYWLSHDGSPVPGWFRASVIKTLLEEAKAQNIEGLDSIVIAYDDLAGTDMQPWQKRGQFSFALVTTNLLEVTEQLTEDDLDVELDAATMELRAWQRRGADLTDTVRLSVGHGLKSYETTRTAPLATIVIGRLADGTWFEVQDSNTYALYGRRVLGISMDSALDLKTAKAAAQTILDENSSPTIVLTAETSAAIGPQPFVDWQVGDTVLVPGHKGVGTMPARCLSITVDASGDNPRIWSEFVTDASSPAYSGPL